MDETEETKEEVSSQMEGTKLTEEDLKKKKRGSKEMQDNKSTEKVKKTIQKVRQKRK